MPGFVVNVLPQILAGLVVGRVFTVPSKPLYAAGPGPAVRELSFHPEKAHHVTVCDGSAAATVGPPRLKAPRVRKAHPPPGARRDGGR